MTAESGDGEDGDSKVVPLRGGKRRGKAAAEAGKGAPDPLAKVKAALTPDSKTRSLTPAGRPRLSAPELPGDCPVVALGTCRGVMYLCDRFGQLHAIDAAKMSRPVVLGLFAGSAGWLYDLFPHYKKVDDADGFVIDDWVLSRAQETLFEACAKRGLWEPQNRVRGRGAWATDDGRLALHTGSAVYLSGDGPKDDVHKPGPVDLAGYIYPAAQAVAQPMPLKGRAPFDGMGAAGRLLELFETWRWRRDFDARLLLGWLAAAMVGGALKVRPICWITGPRGAGKSALTGEGGVLDRVLDRSGVFTTNSTAAGVFQKLNFDSLPVVVDEIEAKRGNERAGAMIELARQAFSGGALLRGGATGAGVEFQARSAMLFSSILIPPLMPQDQSRLAVLSLLPFEAHDVEPRIDPAELRAIGAALLRRWLQRWDRWAERLELWRAGLRRAGHDGRGQDAFGTLLAAADLMLTDDPPEAEDVDVICGQMLARAMAETRSDGDATRQCVVYAMSRMADRYRGGEVMTVGEWVRAALSKIDGAENGNPPAPAEAARVLARYGVLPVWVGYDPEGRMVIKNAARVSPEKLHRAMPLPGQPLPAGLDGWVGVAFANHGDGVLSLFEGSDWEGAPGARNPYTQALERLPGAFTPGVNVRIGSAAGRCVIVPVQECLALDDGEAGG